MIGVFLWANRHPPGALLLATGAGMNFLAILLNGGVMPAAASALVIYAGMLVLLHRTCGAPRPRVQRDPGVQI